MNNLERQKADCFKIIELYENTIFFDNSDEDFEIADKLSDILSNLYNVNVEDLIYNAEVHIENIEIEERYKDILSKFLESFIELIIAKNACKFSFANSPEIRLVGYIPKDHLKKVNIIKNYIEEYWKINKQEDKYLNPAAQ